MVTRAQKEKIVKRRRIRPQMKVVHVARVRHALYFQISPPPTISNLFEMLPSATIRSDDIIPGSLFRHSSLDVPYFLKPF